MTVPGHGRACSTIALVLSIALAPVARADARQAPDQAVREVLGRLGAAYQAERRASEGFVVEPAAAIERLLGDETVTILDVRAAGEASDLRLRGSVVRPLEDLLASGGALEAGNRGPILVVDADGRAAIEAMVFLRLNGREAFAVAGGLPALWRAAAPPAGSRPPDPQAREESGRARALFEGAATARPAAPPPAAAPASAAPDAAAARPPATPDTTLVVAIAAAGAVAVGGLLFGLFMFVSRWRKRRRLLEAFAIIDRDDTNAFPKAADLLDQAATSGLRPADVADARFALAYVKARMGDLSQAEGVLNQLVGSGQADRHVRYLLLWVLVAGKKWDEAVRCQDESADVLAGYLDAAELAGRALLERARICLAERRTESALAYFERVRALDVFADRLPPHLDDHETALGIDALLEKDLDRAREHFTKVGEKAERDGRSPLASQIGLLLCRWRESDRPDVDRDLGRVVEEAAAATEAGEAEAAREHRLLLRNLYLWQSVSRLFLWLALPPRGGLPADERAVLQERLDRVTGLDPDMGDPALIAGLIDYYFAADDDGRASAIARLEHAASTTVAVPEVIHLLDLEQKLARFRADRLRNYLELVRSYLGSTQVPIELRRVLRDRLAGRFKEIGEIELEAGDEVAAPSLQDLRVRGELIHRRLEQIVRPSMRAASEEGAGRIETMLGEFQSAMRALEQTAQSLESAEQDVMVLTGEFLLKDETVAGD